jgi:integrase
LYRLGRQLMGENQAHMPDGDPAMFRSGLIIALLAAAPMRIANLASLRIGVQLRREGAQWSVWLTGSETKTSQADRWPLPAELSVSVEQYLRYARPTLMARACRPVDTDLLWIGDSGRPIGDQVIRRIIQGLTAQHLGVRINPHSFRHAAATTFALEAPTDSRKTAALLGHASPAMTQKHYILQQQFMAQQDYLSIYRARLRGRPPAGQADAGAED